MEESKVSLLFFDTHTYKYKRRQGRERIKFQASSLFFLLSNAHVLSLSLLMRSMMGCVYIFVRCNKAYGKKRERKKKNNTFSKNKSDIKKNVIACGFYG